MLIDLALQVGMLDKTDESQSRRGPLEKVLSLMHCDNILILLRISQMRFDRVYRYKSAQLEYILHSCIYE
jgi:hypothetical protein